MTFLHDHLRAYQRTVCPNAGWGRHIRKQVGSKGFPDEVIAADPGTVFQDPVQDMAEHTFILFIFWKNAPQNRKQPAFFQKIQKQVGVTEDCVYLCLWEEGLPVDTGIILLYWIIRIIRMK